MNENISFSPFTLLCRGRLKSYGRPAVMGILNATADSFYDGGRHTTERQIIERAMQIVGEGGDIIDIGVVSTRPGAILMPPDEEGRRLAAAVRAVRRELPDAVISVDTCFPLPAKQAVDAGADIINDISGGRFDELMFDTVAELRTPYILMHNPYGAVDNPSGSGSSAPSVMESLATDLSALRHKLLDKGVRDIIIDPGFGFSKTLDDNYRLIAHLEELKTLFPGNPLLVALSRKSMIFKLLNTTPDDSLAGTTALHTVALLKGAQLLRVHDVHAAVQTVAVALRVAEGCRD